MHGTLHGRSGAPLAYAPSFLPRATAWARPRGTASATGQGYTTTLRFTSPCFSA